MEFMFTHGLALVVGVCLLTAVALSQDFQAKAIADGIGDRSVR